MNILTFDIEEWFHLLDFDATRTESEWGKYEVRIYENVDRIFRILDESNTKATFFIIGWVAKTYPELVKKIAAKYQIGSHTMNHQLVWQQSKSEFKEDVTSSIKLLEDITGQKVECFRAPGFSVREKDAWAYEILSEAGIKYDCSVFPAAHAHGGMPSYPKAAPCVIEYKGVRMKEFPVSFTTVAGKHIIFSGGGYFRLLPYSLIERWSRETSLNNGYLLGYIHPRDLDPGQPMLKGLPMARKIKSYIGLSSAEKKLRCWLKDFQFTDIATANKSIEWSQAPVVKL